MQIAFSQELLNHDKVVTDFVTEAIKQDKLAQAYLLTGQSQEYKDLLVKDIAKALNCTSLQNEIKPCNQCTNCQWIENNTHPEVPIIINIQEGKSQINVEQIEILKSQILKSSKFFKVIYFPEAEYKILNKHATNSLLKYIEEPPPKTLFIFSARDIDNVLNTIVSRCQPLYINKSANILAEGSNSGEELFNNIQNINNYYDCTVVAEGLEIEDIENLADYIAGLILDTNNNSKGLERYLNLIKEAQEKLLTFCNKKLVIEELLWEMARG